MRLSSILMACAVSVSSISLAVAQSEESVLRVIPHADLTGIDPSTSSLIMRMHTLMVYETLFALDSEMTPQPMMLESYEVSDDHLVYTFTLRSDLAFHDGSAVGSEDVLVSLERWMVRDAIGQRLADVTESLEAIDERTLRLTLSQPYGLVEYSLAASSPLTPVIMRAQDVPEDPMAPITTVIGSGPLKFVEAEWRTGSQVVYERNEAYVPRDEEPDGLAGRREVNFDRIELVIIPDANTAASALAAGEVDFWDTPTLDLIPLLDVNPDIEVGATTNLQAVAYLRPNHLYPPFDDVRVRQALALSVDQEEYMSVVAGDPDRWQACYSYLICGSPYGFENSAENLHTNAERARELLAEAGYDGEPVILLGSPQLPIVSGVAQVAAQSMREVGFNVDLQMMDWGSMVQRFSNNAAPEDGGYNVFSVFSTGPLFFHPLTNVAINTSCDGMNFAGWPCDEETENLRTAFFDAVTEEERQQAAMVLQERLVDIVPYAIVGQLDQPHAWRSDLSGVLDANVLVFWNISKD